MPTDLFKLTFAVQLAIGAGYLAYLIAYAGIRQHHTAPDAILKSFAFGVPASAIMTYGYQATLLTPIIAFASAIAAGISWRAFGMAGWAKLMRKARVSWADDIPTAWLSVTATRTDVSPSQIAVETIDGRLLLCEDTRMFGDAHEGPVTFGLIGDVALYVTAEQRLDGTWDEKVDVRHSDGDLMTYIPASQIKRVEMRYFSEKAAKAAAKAARAEAAAAEQVEPNSG